MTLKYFLYGRGPLCAKTICPGISLSLILFDYDVTGCYRFDGRCTNHTFLLRHFENDHVEFCGIGPNGELCIEIY